MTDILTGLALLALLVLVIYTSLRLLAWLVLGKQTRGDRAFNRLVSRGIAGKLRPGEAERFWLEWETRDDHIERRRDVRR